MNRPGFGPNLMPSTRARIVRASMAPIFAMALFAMLLFAMCVPATAQVFNGESPSIHAVPASVLIFPLFDSAPDRGTLISVTNTNSSRVSCGNTFLSGDIALHYTYFNNDANGNCYEFDRVEYLTPGDTLTIVADDHNPEMDEGWLWIETLDPETYEPITFNHIIGSAIIVEAGSEFLWSYTPYAFKALVEAPCDGFDLPCGSQTRCINDLDGEVDADFDGVEFTPFPDSLLLDGFFEEGLKNITNELTIMTTREFDDTNLQFLIWNNSETRFSRGFSFECHYRGPLSDISPVVNDLRGTDDERFPTGWVEIQSAAGILGVFKQQKGPFGAGKELFAEGEQTDVSIERFDLRPQSRR